MTDVYILSAVRTPIGKLGGSLSSLPAHQLGQRVISEVLHRAQVDPGEISEVVMGQVLTAGCGQNPARQAAIGAGMAAASGVLFGPLVGVHHAMGLDWVLKAFIVVVVGGMGSLPGAIVAGLLMGEIVSLTTFFAPRLAELIIFIVMAIVLLVRPSGLFGEAGLAE